MPFPLFSTGEPEAQGCEGLCSGLVWELDLATEMERARGTGVRSAVQPFGVGAGFGHRKGEGVLVFRLSPLSAVRALLRDWCVPAAAWTAGTTLVWGQRGLSRVT